MSHEFYLELLRQTRADAKSKGVKVPKGLTALGSDIGSREQWFIEAKENSPRVYVKGDCAYSARANSIMSLIKEDK